METIDCWGNPGDLVYKRVGSALAKIISVADGIAVIEYLYTIRGAKKKAGDTESVAIKDLMLANEDGEAAIRFRKDNSPVWVLGRKQN